MSKKDLSTQIMWILQKSHRVVMNYLNSLSEGERTASGSFEAWAPKDRLSHITYWRRRTVESLSYISRGQTPPEYPPYEECNRLNFEETKDKSVKMLIHDAENVLEAFPLVLQRFSEEGLRSAGSHPREKEGTLLSYILGNGYVHPVYHITEAYLKLGDLETANRLQDMMVSDMLGLDDSPRSQGAILYDRACFYALSGRPAQALEFLRRALAFRPDLKAWAKEDSDLASIREEPEFFALTNE
ncbi:MAG: TPR end-of-group domain-containing protein [Bellilinea sp.]